MKAVAIAIMLGLSFNTYAITDSKAEACGSIASLANVIMKGRQSGVSIVRAMEISGENAAIKAVTELAYMKPRYQSDEYREIAAQDFEVEVYLACNGKH